MSFGRGYEHFSRIVQGAGLTEIAEKGSLSIKSVSAHKSHVLAEMNLASNVDLSGYTVDHILLRTARE